jgi:hypothetical protein
VQHNRQEDFCTAQAAFIALKMNDFPPSVGLPFSNRVLVSVAL